MWYKYMVDYYLAIRREKIVSFSKTWIDLEIVIRSEVSDKNIYNSAYMRNLAKGYR